MNDNSMKTISKIKGHKVRVFLIVLLNIIGIYSCSTHAQSLRTLTYKGFDVSFGARSFEVNSNIKEINNMQAMHQGGSLGLTFGNELLRARLAVAGVYYSDDHTPRTQQLFETSITSNFYPRKLIRANSGARLQPYLATGFALTNARFYGTYLENQALSHGYEPLLGKISLLNVKCGLGLEYQVINDIDFVHVFVEALYGAPMLYGYSNKALSNTTIKKFTSLSFGISFGMHRGNINE